MKYIICDRILFIPDLNMLFLIDNREDVVTISNPARRLLELLITSQGKNVPREEIFRKVWDDFGMVSSNNNLNHCISKLRRVLRSLGIEDEVIITIPKLGFTLHKEISVRAVEDEEPQHALHQSADAVQPEQPRVATRWQALGRQTIFFLGGAFIILLGLLIVRLHLYPRTQAEIYLGTIESCKVYLRERRGQDQPLIMQSVRRYLSQRPVSCLSEEYLLIYSQTPGADKENAITQLHITRCGLHRANQIALCTGL